MPELMVAIDGDHVGDLEGDRNGASLRFSYRSEWIRRPDATPLSVTMPLRSGSFDHRVVHPYLWGLLPDNDAVVQRWARQFACSPTNVLALLGHVGSDVAGAAQYLRPGTPPDEGADPKHDLLDDGAVAARLRAIANDSVAWHADRSEGRWSLAGAQAKIALAHDDDRGWSIPHGRAPTTHILKPAIAGLADHALNELLCVRAASKLGLSTEAAAIEHFDDQRAFVARRYDRITRDGRIRRIHQEDVCQALGVHPASKYQNEGGPSFEDMVELLRDHGTSSSVDISRLCDATAFNWLILGSDAHAKNYSLLLSGRQVRLAPLYDLASAAPYPHAPKVSMAQKIGGEYKAGKIGTRHWRRLAAAAGIDPDALLQRLHLMATAIPDAFSEATAESALTNEERRTAAAITDTIARWATTRLADLTPPSPSRQPPAATASTARQVRRPKGTPSGGRFATPASEEAGDPTDT